MKILGWLLFVLNIASLIYCIYSLQFEPISLYLLASGILLAQTVFIAKTLRIIKKTQVAQEMLIGAAKSAGLEMAKIFNRKK